MNYNRPSCLESQSNNLHLFQLITQTFEDILFNPQSGCLKEFPSPEELKYRIIISTKPPKEYLKAKSELGDNPQKGSDSDEDAWAKAPPDLTNDQEDDHTVC